MRIKENNISKALDDINVNYSDEGKSGAAVIIFIHGFPFNKSMWNSQINALKEKYRVIAYNIRGHGNSDTGEKDFSIELFAKDLVILMDILKIDKAILCGLSMGGYIALNAVLSFPDRFKALVLSDTNCVADTPEIKEKRLKTIDLIRKDGIEKYADESIKNLFSAESFTARVSEIASVRDMILGTSEQSLCKTLIALSVRTETCSRLKHIKIPVLIMVGKEDKLTPPAAARLMNDKLKNSSLKILDHAGHISNMENPDEFNKQLIEFVKTVS